jgi:hypothetical protein
MATIDQTTANTTRRTKSSSSTHYEMHTLLYITLGLGALTRGGVSAFTSATLKRSSLMFAFGLLSDILPKVLNSTEDVHTKNMSTFETDEHLRALTPVHYSTF